MNSLKIEEIPNVLRDKIASKACRAAIKAGDKLNDTDVSDLFKLLGGNLGLKCPHGRPICITLSKKQLEKQFKRS